MKNKIKYILSIIVIFLIFIFLSLKFKSFIFLLLSITVLSTLFFLIKKINKNILLIYFTFLLSIIFVEVILKIDFNKFFRYEKLSSNDKTVIHFDNFKYEKTYLGNQLKKGTHRHYKKDSLIPSIKFLYNYYNSIISRMITIKQEETAVVTNTKK